MTISGNPVYKSYNTSIGRTYGSDPVKPLRNNSISGSDKKTENKIGFKSAAQDRKSPILGRYIDVRA